MLPAGRGKKGRILVSQKELKKEGATGNLVRSYSTFLKCCIELLFKKCVLVGTKKCLPVVSFVPKN